MIKIKTFILYLIRVFFIIISIYESYIRENEKYNFYLYYFDYFLGVVGLLSLFFEFVFDLFPFALYSIILCIYFIIKESNDFSKMGSHINSILIKDLFKFFSLNFKDYNDMKESSFRIYNFYKFTILNTIKVILIYFYYLLRFIFTYNTKKEAKNKREKEKII